MREETAGERSGLAILFLNLSGYVFGIQLNCRGSRVPSTRDYAFLEAAESTFTPYNRQAGVFLLRSVYAAFLFSKVTRRRA